MTDTTVIIKTIGRPTLKAAIRSARAEGFKVIVVSDGAKVSAQGASRLVTLGRKWGYYGGMAANVGAALVETEFLTFLDDDDLFAVGAGDIIRRKLKEDPSVDLWIGGLEFNQNVRLTNNGDEYFEGRVLCMNGDLGVTVGNVAMPTYRASVFSKIPFTDTVPESHAEMIDLAHIQMCQQYGYKIDWFGEIIYRVRPEDGAANGRGEY